MGDRANVFVKSDYKDDHGVYLYTHWRGSELPETLRDALKRGRGRWDDESYLTRIIFSEMIKDRVMEDTGYGISSFITDGDDRILTVNVSTATVSFKDKSWSFSEYIEMTDAELEEVWE